MRSDTEAWLPPDEPAAFESLSLDLWKEIWGPDSGAQKNGRSGQTQAGVDVFGHVGERWVGVQCKQKSGLLLSKLTGPELDEEVEKARSFVPSLSQFLVATTGPRDKSAAQNPGLCVVTTRESVKDLAAFHGGTAPEWSLERLSTVAGVALLEQHQVKGKQEELAGLVEEVEHSRSSPAALPGRRPWLPRGATGGGTRRGLLEPHPAREGSLQHE